MLPILLGLACAEAPTDSGCGPTWEVWGASFFAQWCDSCHAASSPNRYGAPEGVSFDDLDEVLAAQDRILARVVEAQDMPPGGGLTDEERELLEDFLACEAP